jgi:hypothetical protein
MIKALAAPANALTAAHAAAMALHLDCLRIMSLSDPGPSIGMSKNRPTRTRAEAIQNPAAANANKALTNVALFMCITPLDGRREAAL